MRPELLLDPDEIEADLDVTFGVPGDQIRVNIPKELPRLWDYVGFVWNVCLLFYAITHLSLLKHSKLPVGIVILDSMAFAMLLLEIVYVCKSRDPHFVLLEPIHVFDLFLIGFMIFSFLPFPFAPAMSLCRAFLLSLRFAWKVVRKRQQLYTPWGGEFEMAASEEPSQFIV